MRWVIPRPWVVRQPALRAVLGLTLLAGLVTGVVVPFLSLVAREKGASYGAVGLMASGFLLAQLVFQFPAGALADRIGRAKPVAAGLAIEGLATAGFAFVEAPSSFVALRVLQGVGLALIYPAVRALIADLTPLERRGEAYAAFWGVLNVGWLLGPAVGGLLAAVVGKTPLVVASGLGEAALALPAWLAFRRFRLPEPKRKADALGSQRGERLLGTALVAAMLLAFAFEVPVGIFTGIWSIYLSEIGASELELGLSYTAFSVADLVTLPLGGKLANRRPRWRRVLGLAVLLGIVVLGYGIPSVPIVLLLGALEGAIAGLLTPTVDAYLSGIAGAQQQGRVQGAYTTAGMSGAALSALGSSVLYSWGHWVPFLVAGTALASLAVPAALLMRRTEQRAVREAAVETVVQ
jgi:MFS family permease